MKQCIITGGGSKFGAMLTENLLAKNYYVHLITSNSSAWSEKDNVNVIDVDWKNLDLKNIKDIIPVVNNVDVILFNHNASSLSLEKFYSNALQSSKHWQQSYFTACQFPYYFIHILSKKINESTKIGWMLSNLIQDPYIDQVGFSDYIGNKFTNACIMKSFSVNYPACFFGLYPEGGLTTDSATKAKNMIDFIDTADVKTLNGNIFDSHGTIFRMFK
jgi:hypothetical protein